MAAPAKRALLLMLLVVGWAMMATGDSGAQAQTRCGTEIFYYSDPAFTDLVGIRGWLPDACGCGFYSSGSTSPYSTVSNSFC